MEGAARLPSFRLSAGHPRRNDAIMERYDTTIIVEKNDTDFM